MARDISYLLQLGLPICRIQSSNLSSRKQDVTEEADVLLATVHAPTMQSSRGLVIEGLQPEAQRRDDLQDGRRLLFLDVDGVLHPLRIRLLSGSTRVDTSHCFQSSCMSQLKRVVDVTGASIVLSSSWRRYEHARERLASELAKIGLHFTEWTTTAGDESASARVDQILAFVARARDVSAWAAVDDDDLAPDALVGSESMMRAVFRQSFVRTDADVGLTCEKADKLIGILLEGSDSESDVELDQSESAVMRIARRCLDNFESVGWGASTSVEIACGKLVQNLWSGLGSILEFDVVVSGVSRHIILKTIAKPAGDDFEKQRDYQSYVVEACFYNHGHAKKACDVGSICPLPLLVDCTPENSISIGMTRLQGWSCAGGAGKSQIRATLQWLARFHAMHWGHARADDAVGTGLHAQGCYWNLDARQLELARTARDGLEGRLYLAARALDLRMKSDTMQTVCHGDPKDANIIDAEDGTVGLCDFQWVGKAPPTKDLAYCLVCGAETLSLDEEEFYLRLYYDSLATLLHAQNDAIPSFDCLRDSYVLAMADLARWMAGWGWWGHVRVVKGHAMQVLDKLDGGSPLLSEAAYIERMESVFPT